MKKIYNPLIKNLIKAVKNMKFFFENGFMFHFKC